MPFYDIITLIGFGFGVALSITLFTLSMQRLPKRAIDVAFGILFLSFILWFGGQFFSLLVDLLFGSVAQLEVKTLVIISYAGLALIPSSLLHIQLASLQSARGHDRLGVRNLIIIFAFYCPSILFIAMNAAAILQRIALNPGHSEIVYIPFALWMIFSITIFVTFSEKLIETVKFESDRQFYRDISYVLASIGLGVIIVYVFSFYRLPYAGQYLDLFMLLSPAIPMAVFLYYVYRYNFYRLVIKPSLVYSVIYGTVMAIYLVGIRRFGQYLSQFPEVSEELIEGLLLIALVFAFQPFRSMLQTRLDKIFFKDRYYYQQFLRELSDSISGIVDLEQLLQTIRHSMVATLKITECTIIILQQEDDRIAIAKKSGDAEFPHLPLLINALQETRHFRPRRQLNDHRVFTALKQNNLALAMPVYLRQEIRGLIALSEKETGNPFSDEELDVLQTFANQIGLAIENARLVQERLELIERIHQAEKSNSLGQLATTMSHEIKNPLSSIKTIVQVLQEKADGEERQDLNLVMSEINRLHSILEKLLSYARPAETSTERVDVGVIIEEVLALLKHQAQQKSILLDFHRPDSIPALIAKRQSIREIIFNLVLNAVQAIERDGAVRMSLLVGVPPAGSERRNRMKDTPYLIFVCQDDGPGIASELHKKIFEPFYTSKTVGTGLGLTIVKRNVDELDGVIEVKSNARSGTRFTVYFPVRLENHLNEGE